jgi:hypothetical protein
MTKRELIDQIIGLNATASPAFLARFKQQDLEEYMEHLKWVANPAAGPAARPAAQDLPTVAVRQTAAAPSNDSGGAGPAAAVPAEASSQDQSPPAATPQAEPVYASDVNPVEEAGQPDEEAAQPEEAAAQLDEAQPVGVASEASSSFAQEEPEESQTFLF